MSKGGRNYQRTGVDRGSPSSTPANIEAWLARQARKPGVTSAVLLYESLSGTEEVEQWQMAELEHSSGETIFAAANEHAEDLGAVGRYTLRLLDKDGNACGAKHMRVVPPNTDDMPIGAGEVEDSSASGVIAQCLRHNEIMMRMHSGALNAVLVRMHDLLRMEQSENDRLRVRLRTALRENEVDPEDEADRQEQSAALSRFTDAIAEHVIPTIARAYAQPPKEH